MTAIFPWLILGAAKQMISSQITNAHIFTDMEMKDSYIWLNK